MTSNVITTADAQVAPRQMYSLSFVIIVALISFLLGSLIRSLLTPGYALDRAGVDQVERALFKMMDSI